MVNTALGKLRPFVYKIQVYTGQTSREDLRRRDMVNDLLIITFACNSSGVYSKYKIRNLLEY